MVIPEMGTIEMPVKVFCLDVKRETICNKWIDCLSYSFNFLWRKISLSSKLGWCRIRFYFDFR